MPTHLYLIRHGEALSGVVDGKNVELGLSPEGAVQVGKLRDRLARTGEITPDVLLTSPLQRAHETANLIAPVFGLPVTVDAGLEEWNAEDGTLTEDEFMAVWRETPDAEKPFYRFSAGCETLVEFWARTHADFDRILSAYDGKTLVAVTHGGVIQSLLGYFFRYRANVLPPVGIDLKRASITHWYVGQSGRWTLERFNDYAHLA